MVPPPDDGCLADTQRRCARELGELSQAVRDVFAGIRRLETGQTELGKRIDVLSERVTNARLEAAKTGGAVAVVVALFIAVAGFFINRINPADSAAELNRYLLQREAAHPPAQMPQR